MRQRKKPILLVTVLACAVAAVAFMNTPTSPGESQPDPATAPETGKEVDTPDKSAITKQVQQLAKAPKKPDPKTMMGEGPHHDGPLALKDQPKPYVPVPSDSATSVQWYTDQTLKEIPAAPKTPPKMKVPPPPSNLPN